MTKKIEIDGHTFLLSRIRLTKEWHVFRDRHGGELGRFDDAGNILTVDQRGDLATTTALVKRISDEVLKTRAR